jgi:hypothetical protein
MNMTLIETNDTWCDTYDKYDMRDTYTSPRQYFKCFGFRSIRGRALTDLTVLKKLPPSQPSWPRAAGNKHIFGGLCRRNLFNKRLVFCDQI